MNVFLLHVRKVNWFEYIASFLETIANTLLNAFVEMQTDAKEGNKFKTSILDILTL